MYAKSLSMKDSHSYTASYKSDNLDLEYKQRPISVERISKIEGFYVFGSSCTLMKPTSLYFESYLNALGR